VHENPRTAARVLKDSIASLKSILLRLKQHKGRPKKHPVLKVELSIYDYRSHRGENRRRPRENIFKGGEGSSPASRATFHCSNPGQVIGRGVRKTGKRSVCLGLSAIIGFSYRQEGDFSPFGPGCSISKSKVPLIGILILQRLKKKSLLLPIKRKVRFQRLQISLSNRREIQRALISIHRFWGGATSERTPLPWAGYHYFSRERSPTYVRGGEVRIPKEEMFEPVGSCGTKPGSFVRKLTNRLQL